jgi:hypothetical protein
MFTTQKGTGEVSFNPHAAVLYGPAERAVCILKRIITAHSSTLYTSLCQSRPSSRFITAGPDRLFPVEFMAGLHTAVRSTPLRSAESRRRGSTVEDILAQFRIEFCCFVLLPLRRRVFATTR